MGGGVDDLRLRLRDLLHLLQAEDVTEQMSKIEDLVAAFSALFPSVPPDAIRCWFRLSAQTGLSEWQPIEAVPDDDNLSSVLVSEGGLVGEAYYSREEKRWFWANTGPGDYPEPRYLWPTHWQKMPEGPKRCSDEQARCGFYRRRYLLVRRYLAPMANRKQAALWMVLRCLLDRHSAAFHYRSDLGKSSLTEKARSVAGSPSDEQRELMAKWPSIGPYTILVPCLRECDCGATWYGDPDKKMIGLYWWTLLKMPKTNSIRATDATIIGEWFKAEPRSCGSSMAHDACKFAGDGMKCDASPRAYNDCPYRQKGDRIASY